MDQKKFNFLIKSLAVFIVLTIPSYAQKIPKMVLCITVDQLRQDYLSELDPILSKQGFKRILGKGRLYNNLKFNYKTKNSASTIASIFTGVYPNVHGIDFPYKYNTTTLKQENVFNDNSFGGIYTQDKLSPQNMKCETISDIIKTESNHHTIVYSVAPYSYQAIAFGGRLADGVYWIDDQIASCASSQYYEKTPWFINDYNKSDNSPLNALAKSNKKWTPIYKVAQSLGLDNNGFEYTFNSRNINTYKQSKLVNDEIAEIAKKIISLSGFKDKNTYGVLSVVFDASSFPQSKENGLNSEVAEKYKGIDDNISSILNLIDESIGLNNCLITLNNTGYYIDYTKYNSKKEELTFDSDRVEAILNMYISALYGQGKWINGINDGRLYLNRNLIQSKKIDLGDILEKTSSLLKEIDGIECVITFKDILSNNMLKEKENQLLRSVYYDKNIDIYWSLKKGYKTKNANVDYNVNNQSKTVHTDLFFVLCDPSLRSEKIPFDIRSFEDITKSISWVMRIRPPTDN